MGRLSEGAILDLKGVSGPAFLDAEGRSLRGPVWSVPTEPPNESWPYQTFRHFNPKGRLNRVTYEIEPRDGEGLLLSLRWLPQYAWLTLDGKPIGEHAGDLSLAGGVDFSNFVLDPYLKPRAQKLEITFFGDPLNELGTHIRMLAYRKESELTRWAFRPWNNPQTSGDASVGDPLWWECQFEKPEARGPFFLVTQGLSKGQAWLNGHALGRYWEIGPQHSLYAPEPWFMPSNRLSIFDEEGKRPDKVYLMRDARVPVQSVWV